MRSARRIAAERAAIPLWVIAAHVDWCPVDERALFVERVRDLDEPSTTLLVTCHRAELFGAGPAPEAEELLRTLDSGALRGHLRLSTGEAAARHAFRLAAGLESAVIGEDQVLHQVRGLREDLRGRAVDSHLPRLFELAIGVGRRARAARSEWGPSDASLAGRAIDWLCLRGDARPGDTVLVVGAGTMGGLLAREARRRRFEVIVASRTESHAAAIGGPIGARPLDLVAAAEVATSGHVGGVAIALGGEWTELPREAALPPTVDLSSPPAIPHFVATHRGHPGPSAPQRPGAAALLDIDGLYSWDGVPRPGAAADAYATVASALVDEALERYARWSAGRGSLETLRAMRERAEIERTTELERLLRRLPGLDGRDRALVEAFSEQLVAALLHAPTARLRDDTDGTAADAARRLFDLEP